VEHCKWHYGRRVDFLYVYSGLDYFVGALESISVCLDKAFTSRYPQKLLNIGPKLFCW